MFSILFCGDKRIVQQKNGGKSEVHERYKDVKHGMPLKGVCVPDVDTKTESESHENKDKLCDKQKKAKCQTPK